MIFFINISHSLSNSGCSCITLSSFTPWPLGIGGLPFKCHHELNWWSRCALGEGASANTLDVSEPITIWPFSTDIAQNIFDAVWSRLAAYFFSKFYCALHFRWSVAGCVSFPRAKIFEYICPNKWEVVFVWGNFHGFCEHILILVFLELFPFSCLPLEPILLYFEYAAGEF